MENQKYCEFIKGFANGLDVDYPEAREFYSLLNVSENDVAQGEDRGYELGVEYRELYFDKMY